MDLTLRCSCERLQLSVEHVQPATSSRVICHCDGCRAWAERMEPELLDENGGTERIIVNPAALSITRGHEHLACTRQTRRGAHRWSANCCHASLGLTTSSHHMPFVALDLRRVQEPSEVVDQAVGPVRARVNGKFARKHRRALRADLRALFRMLVQLVPLTAAWWWENAHRRMPFVDDKTLEPWVEVRHLEAPRALRLTEGCG